jgi:PAS domain S-box-containing protein
MIDDDKTAVIGLEEVRSLQRQIAELEAANRALKQEVERLKQSPSARVNEPKLAWDAFGDPQHMLTYLIDYLPDPTLVINTHRQVVAWNKAMEKLTGVKAEEMLGKGDYERALPIYSARMPILIDLIFGADEDVASNYDLVRREQDVLVAETGQMLFINGRGLYLQGKASPIYDKEGNLVGAIESLHDITERKLAEELRESEERLRCLAENTGDVLYRLNYDSMRYDYLGPAIKQLTGYWAEEINALGFASIVKKIEVPGEGEENASPEVLIQNRLAGKVGQYQADYLIRTQSGELKWLRDHSFPWCDESGKVIGSVGILSDVTERRLTEDALRESEKRFRTLAEKAPIGISLMHSDLTFEYLNPRFTEILGYTMDDLPGKLQWFEKVYPDPGYRGEVISFWEKDLLENPEVGAVKDRTLTLCCKDGKSKTIHVRSVVMDDGRHLLTYQDMTDHHNLEVHMRQIHKMEAIGTLAGGIAHDFNNILAAIIGYAEMTLTKVAQGSMTERNLGQILKAAHRAKDLIKQILIFTHEGEKEHRPVRITPVVKEALKLLRASIPKTVEIRQNIRLKSDGIVLADPTQIHQVLMNLCTNAAHAMREKGGVLEVSLTDRNPEIEALSMYDKLSDTPYLQLTVSDTGTGIQPAIIERIFDPFFTTKDQGQGTGMGLAVVHGIVKSHDGAITVNSRPGMGSAFTVYLPRYEEKVLAETEAPYLMPRGSGRILFVDDEETLADLGKQMLIDLGYEVVSMTNSREALAVFRAQPGWFDLVFTDYTMPEMTGADLARKIMSLRPDIPVVLCTGYSETINEEKAREIGVSAFVMKPFTHRDIAEVVSKALGEK